MSTALTLTSAASAPLASLPPAVSSAAVAYLAEQMPVRQLSREELVPLVGDLLNGAAVLMGHKNALADLDDLDMMASGCAAMIERRFGAFKPAELSEAFQRGASGEYRIPGDVLLVSLPTVASWLETYQTRARAEAVAAVQLRQQTPQLALAAPRRDLAAEVVVLVAQARAGVLPTGYELDFGNVCYDWLKSLGAFVPFRSLDQLYAMRAEETDRLLATERPGKGAERISYNHFLAALGAGEWKDSHPLSRSVLNACKKRLLREWLLHHAIAETDMPALLAELQNPSSDVQQAA